MSRLVATLLALFLFGLASVAEARNCPEWFARIVSGDMQQRPDYRALRSDLKQFGDPETFAVRMAERAKLYRKTNPQANPLNYPLPENAAVLNAMKEHLQKLKLDRNLPFENATEKAAIEAAHARAIEANIRAIESVEANGYPQLDSIAAMRASLFTMDRFDGFVSLKRLDGLFSESGINLYFEGRQYQSLLRKEIVAFADTSAGRAEGIRKFQDEMYGAIERDLKTHGQLINAREKMRRLMLDRMHDSPDNSLPKDVIDLISGAANQPQLPFLFVSGAVSERTIIESRLFGSEIVGAATTNNVADGQLRSRLEFFDHDLFHGIQAASDKLSNRMISKPTRWKRRLLNAIDSLPSTQRSQAEAVTMFVLREFGATIGKGFPARHDATRIQAMYNSVYSRDLARAESEWMANWANRNLPTR